MATAVNCGFARMCITTKYKSDLKTWITDYNGFFKDYPSMHMTYDQV